MPGLGLRHEALDPNQKDPRNALFLMSEITEQDEALLPDDATWLTRAAALNQGNTGTCVGHAGYGFLIHPPVVQMKPNMVPSQWDLYRHCVTVDEWPDNDHEATLPDRSPGMDFGTSTLALMKSLQHFGLIGRYRWAWDVRTVDHFVRMQGKNFVNRLGGPVIVGTWWYDSMFDPDEENILRITPNSGLAGGHEWLIKGRNASRGLFRMRNSWGSRWGSKGEAWVPDEVLYRLLEREDGDAVTTNELRRLTG